MMRSLLLVLLLAGTANGFFAPLTQLLTSVTGSLQAVSNQIGQTASNILNGATNHVNNAVGNVVDGAGNIYGQLVSTANGVQFAANFLWDNIFGPAYDLAVQGGQLFLDDKFGNLASGIGRRSVLPENALSQKYAQLSALLKSNIHHLYENLFILERDSLIAVQQAQGSLEDKVRSFYDRINDVTKQINVWGTETKQQLELYARSMQGEWSQILNEYHQNIDKTVDTMRTMFQRLVQDLMKNLLAVAMNVLPNAVAAIDSLKQQGFLSFLHD